MSSADFTQFPEEPPRRGCGCGTVGFLAVLGVVAVLVCCCGGAALMYWGMGEFADQVADDLRENPVIGEHIGEIVEIEMNVMGSAEAEGEETFVFDVRGTEGSGIVEVETKTIDDETERVTTGRLTLDDGTSYDLFPENP